MHEPENIQLLIYSIVAYFGAGAAVARQLQPLRQAQERIISVVFSLIVLSIHINTPGPENISSVLVPAPLICLATHPFYVTMHVLPRILHAMPV